MFRAFSVDSFRLRTFPAREEIYLWLDFYSLFLLIITGVIEWPGEDEAPPEDARDLVTKLLEQDPIARLGTAGKWSWGRFYVP